MDLRNGVPRSMHMQLAGYVHLARMIDKCRAVLAGTEGLYLFPCPMDERLLAFAGISSEAFTAAVKSRASDEDVAEWFRRTAAHHDQEELEQWNRQLLLRGPSSTESLTRFIATRDAVDPSRTDITAWSDLLDLEEGRSVPHRALSA